MRKGFMPRIRNVSDVAAWRMCIGCGACAYACPERKIVLKDIEEDGIRPFLNDFDCGGCSDCLKVCPGWDTSHEEEGSHNGLVKELKSGWGSVLELWEGHASDPRFRFEGSSGGAVSALAAFCLERGGTEGVMHIGSSGTDSLRNKTFYSHFVEELLTKTGSRYSPASPCDSLDLLEKGKGPGIFIGKPCDIVGLRKSESLRPSLREKLALAIGFFCAGTPSTRGTLDLISKFGVPPDAVEELRYRGRGWPGMATVRLKGHAEVHGRLSYMEAWGFLQKYRPYRCYLCPDGTGEFADISCGDPWYREVREGEKGYSLVVVRNEKGRRILREAMEAGYLTLNPVQPDVLVRSQENLLGKRQAIWGRLMALKALGIPKPRLEGFSLFKNWRELPFIDKIRSVAGTARRAIQRKYYRPLEFMIRHFPVNRN
jgi:coenzyme F420 hydrogenase subunit beta